jgi:hypothetical protein
MLRRNVGAAICSVLLLGFLAGCAAGPNALSSAAGPHAAGFSLSLWHGLIIPITFLISLFTPKVSIYEVVNNGNWYDFGFIVGVSMVFSGGAGSGSAGRRRWRATRADPSVEG